MALQLEQLQRQFEKSKKNPNKKITIITINKEVTAPPGILVIKFSTIRSPPKPLKTSENKDAPIRIKIPLMRFLMFLHTWLIRF